MLETLGALLVLVSGWLAAEPPPEALRAGEPPLPLRAGVKVPDLNVGDAAPSLAVAKWIKGSPVLKYEPGKVYLVEFWATWCPPCRKSGGAPDFRKGRAGGFWSGGDRSINSSVRRAQPTDVLSE